MKHLIRKQVVALTIAPGQDPFRVQQQASDYFYQRIAPILEKVLDELSDESRVLDIGRMELDLGRLAWHEDHFQTGDEVLYRQLKEQVSRSLEKMAGQHENLTRVAVHERTIEEHACRQWLDYMEKGYLPWSISAITPDWQRQVLETLATDYALADRLKTLIRSHKHALARLVRDHPVSFLLRLAEVLTARSQAALPIRLEEWFGRRYPALEMPDSEKAHQGFRGRAWEILIRAFAEGATDEEAFHALDTVRQELVLKPEPTVPDHLTDEGIFVANAGLVLLHPFFKTLFGHANLLVGEDFAGRLEQEKAVLLLHFAATGKDSAEEHELVVPKLICGIRLQDSLGWESMINEEEKEEVMNMIQAAIEQWDILKNTSADGLREGFLQRSGKLYRADGETRFSIEKNAIDILLDHLPWNISIIKLPWLKELLRVDWR